LDFIEIKQSIGAISSLMDGVSIQLYNIKAIQKWQTWFKSFYFYGKI